MAPLSGAALFAVSGLRSTLKQLGDRLSREPLQVQEEVGHGKGVPLFLSLGFKGRTAEDMAFGGRKLVLSNLYHFRDILMRQVQRARRLELLILISRHGDSSESRPYAWCLPPS